MDLIEIVSFIRSVADLIRDIVTHGSDRIENAGRQNPLASVLARGYLVLSSLTLPSTG